MILYNLRKDLHTMPEITRFKGIIIKMYYKPKEHNPSHIHVEYGSHVCTIDIKNFSIINGDLPSAQEKMVIQWMKRYQYDLLKMWQTQIIKKLPPL